MALFSNQKWFCAMCGVEQFSQLSGNRNVGMQLCSMKCYREFQWRYTLCLLGKDYYPDPKPYQEPE